MIYLNVNEVLDVIDKQFKYDFEGKDKDDHLIGKKAWNNYVSDYIEKETKNNSTISDYASNDYGDKIFGSGRHTKYREDFVEDVINFRKNLLIKQFKSNRKTTINHKAIETFEDIADSLGVKVAEDIYNKRIPKTQYKKISEEKYPIITKEDINQISDKLLEIAIEQLIDVEKFNYDVYQHLVSGSLEHGLAIPVEMIEDTDGNPLGYKIDAKNYLKENIINELINDN